MTKIIKGILERYPDGGQILKVITKLILKIYLYINVYIYIVQSTDTCFTVPQLISVAWYNLDMAWQLFKNMLLIVINKYIGYKFSVTYIYIYI